MSVWICTIHGSDTIGMLHHCSHGQVSPVTSTRRLFYVYLFRHDNFIYKIKMGFHPINRVFYPDGITFTSQVPTSSYRHAVGRCLSTTQPTLQVCNFLDFHSTSVAKDFESSDLKDGFGTFFRPSYLHF